MLRACLLPLSRACLLTLGPTHLCFPHAPAGQNHLTQLPRPHPIRYRQFDALQDMLKSGPFGQVCANSLGGRVRRCCLPSVQAMHV